MYRSWPCTDLVMYRSCTEIDLRMYRNWSCTESVLMYRNGPLSKNYVPKWYVPKVSCTDMDLPRRQGRRSIYRDRQSGHFACYPPGGEHWILAHHYKQWKRKYILANILGTGLGFKRPLAPVAITEEVIMLLVTSPPPQTPPPFPQTSPPCAQ